MAINIDELYNFVQFIANKEQSGYVKPSQFNLAVDRAQMQLFMERYNNPAEYQPGRPIPRVSYQQTQKISDDLLPFIRIRTYTLNAQGRLRWTRVNDYMHISSIRGHYEYEDDCGNTTTLRKRVKVVDDAEVSDYLNSPITMPTVDYPIAAIYNDFLQIYPVTVEFIDLTYLTRPPVGEWAWTVANNQPVYDATASTDLVWSDELFNEIAIRILSFVGINLREMSISQYSETKKQQGI